MYVAILAFDASNRVTHFKNTFQTEQDALDWIESRPDDWPDAFAALQPEGSPRDWVVDVVLKTLTYDNALAIADAKTNACAVVDDLRDAKSSADFSHGGMVFDADDGSQFAIHAEITDGSTPPVVGDGESMTWILADNTEPTITVGDFRAMARALKVRVKSNASNARTHKDNILALTTVAAIEAYDITTGWAS